jgi:hypothetical protein
VTHGPLHSLFERLFGHPDGVPTGRDHAHDVAHLAAAVGRQQGDGHAEFSDRPEESAATTAAYLDGGLDKAAQRDADRRARSPATLHEVASAEAFLHAVETHSEAAPADLVASVIARGRPTTVVKLPASKAFAIWKWSGAALALAAAIAVLVIVYRQSSPTDSSTPIIAKSAPSSAMVPEPSAVARQPQPPQGNTAPPPVAGKEAETLSMVPVGNQATVPSSKPRKPSLALEEREVLPVAKGKK